MWYLVIIQKMIQKMSNDTNLDIGQLLRTPLNDALTEQLQLMCHFGICYQLPRADDDIDCYYLFPSLGTEKGNNSFFFL